MGELVYMTHPLANLSNYQTLTEINNKTFCLNRTLRVYVHCFLSNLTISDEEDDISNITEIEGHDYCLSEDRQTYVLCNPTTPQVYQVPLSIILLLSSFYGIISLLAIIGNTFVIYIVITSRRMQTVTNLYIANLALSDVILAMLCIPFQFRAALMQRWDLPAFMCHLCPFVQIMSVNVSTWTLVAICLDRYHAIINPLASKQSKSKAKMVILTIWIMAILIALPVGPAHTYDDVLDPVNGGQKPFCSVRGSSMALNNSAQDEIMFLLFQVYYGILVIIEYVIPLIVMVIAYIKMGKRLWGAKTPGQAQASRDDKILRNKKKVIKMLVMVVVVFAVCWLPFQIYQVGSMVYPPITQWKYINILFFIFHWLAMSNSCYNPFIYGIFSEKFQREFKLRLSWLRCRKSQDHLHSPTDSEFDLATETNVNRIVLRKVSRMSDKRETQLNNSSPPGRRLSNKRTLQFSHRYSRNVREIEIVDGALTLDTQVDATKV